ncbi:MAG: hypothetical protein P8J87_20490 [Verrucomicrobiales bacterium]|nr:hypothetical protein [Verrucomicrobiales bacterium]
MMRLMVLIVGTTAAGCAGPKDYGYGFNNPDRQAFGLDGERVPAGEVAWGALGTERAGWERDVERWYNERAR